MNENAEHGIAINGNVIDNTQKLIDWLVSQSEKLPDDVEYQVSIATLITTAVQGINEVLSR